MGTASINDSDIFHWLFEKKYRWQRHGLFWLMLNVVYAFLYYLMGNFSLFWWSSALLMPCDIAVTYICAYWLVPRYLLRKKYHSFLLGFLLVFLLFMVVTRLIRVYLLLPAYMPPNTSVETWNLVDMIYNGMLTYMVVFFFMGIRFFKFWFSNEIQREKLQQQNLKSELALLRSQLNPHFIFNTLNNIDTLIFKDPVTASKSIEKLGGTMRYMLYETDADWVTLEQELDYLRSMVDLIGLRLYERNAIRLKISGNSEGKFMPPMLLVPFLENAYKHGLKKGVAPLIDIKIHAGDSDLTFQINNQVSEKMVRKDPMGGIGLANVKRRLDLIFRHYYNLQIRDSNNLYEVVLTVPWIKANDYE